MFRKYEKTCRILTPHINVPGKYYLSDKEASTLLGARVIIEEKMDGANIGVIRTKDGFRLQKRGSLVGQSEHEQFQFFHAWSTANWEKLMKIPKGIILYGELLRCVHSIHYTSLPDYVLFFDAFNTRSGEFLNLEERNAICNEAGLSAVPLIANDFVTKESLEGMIEGPSAYGPEKEGIVIKRYTKRGYIKAKLVRPEFIKQMEENEHWMHQRVQYNQLATKPTE